MAAGEGTVYAPRRNGYTEAVKKICDTILDAIGHTPMVRINRITRGVVEATVLAKLETFNPGNSIKDRMARPDDRGRRARGRC